MWTSWATVCPSSTMIFFVQWVSIAWKRDKHNFTLIGQHRKKGIEETIRISRWNCSFRFLRFSEDFRPFPENFRWFFEGCLKVMQPFPKIFRRFSEDFRWLYNRNHYDFSGENEDTTISSRLTFPSSILAGIAGVRISRACLTTPRASTACAFNKLWNT